MRLLINSAIALAASLSLAVPAHAAWYEAKSKHFIVYANEPPDELRGFAEKLERFDQAVRYVRNMSDPDLTDSERIRVYELPGLEAVGRLARNSDVAGFYEQRASGSAAFVPHSVGMDNAGFLTTDEIFFHEYAHHLQLQDSSIAMPEWVREGFAEFFATAKISADGSVIIGNPPQYRSDALFYFNKDLTLEQMLGGTYKTLDPVNEDVLYAEGWLLTHYLTFNDSRKGQLGRYVDGIQAGKSALDSAKAAFGDLTALDHELEQYKRVRFTAVRIDGKILHVGTIALRQLRPGEAAIMDVHIRSTRGVGSKAAQGLAADARKIAASYPGDPFVQSCLAEADYDAADYSGASAAADRALSVDPSDIDALIYKGRAEMALAQLDPAHANWPTVRSWFLKANKVDSEDAAALQLFYQSFLAAGQPTTTNADDALLYAVRLAPLDQDVRLLAVRQLLTENRLSDAREMIELMAYEPHTSSTWRQISARILDSIISGNSKSALASVEQALSYSRLLQEKGLD